MKTDATQQEILLVTTSSFAHREWSERDEENKAKGSDMEELQKACWNGLLKEMLPEIDPEFTIGKKLWLWQIRETRSFLEIELSDYPSPKEKWFSIDPYAFLQEQDYN
ncbi:MAG TPA: hypothetical protein VK543_01710 [Puia sp.]|nr:hypothetical protein [Puia sp.]